MAPAAETGTEGGEATITKNEQAPEPQWKNFMLVPAAMFLYIFANNVISTPLMNLLMNRVCLHKLNYSADVCDNLNNYTDIEDTVQVKSTLIYLYSTMISTLPSACLSVFVGPWSDKYGRKIPMYVSVIGSMLYDVCIVIYGVTPDAPFYVLWLASIPTGLTGAAVTFHGCAYSLAADSADFKTRTRKFALLQVAFAAGTGLGSLAAAYLYKSGYGIVFGLGLATHFVTLVILRLGVKDDMVRKVANAKDKFLDFFSLENLKENFRVVTRKRENSSRAQVLLIIASNAIIYLNMLSLGDVHFPYCRKMYKWDVGQYNTANAIYAVSSVVVLTVTIPVLIRILKVPDSWLGVIGSTSYVAENVIKAFAYHDWMYYISLAVSLFMGIAPFAAQSRLSKTVRDDELGSVFAFTSALQNMAPIVGSPLYTNVYNATIKSFTGCVFLVAAGTLLLPLVVFLWLTRVKNNTYVQSTNEDESAEQCDAAVRQSADECRLQDRLNYL